MNELKIIKELYNKRKNDASLDDCYLFDRKYLITTDTICENTHFKHEWSSPQDIACKLIEVNVSDIAASGGEPKLAFLNLGLSKLSGDDRWLKPFLRKFKKCLRNYNIQLEGGDTYKSTQTNLTLTLIGKTSKPILRHTGKQGNLIYMTGSIGLSYMGHQVLQNNISLPPLLKKKALTKHLHPTARLACSRQLVNNFNISAMMDITDGLVQDCEKLALASGLKMHIEIDKIPNIKEYQKFLSIDEILTSGEELELLFLSSSKIVPVKGCPISCIGTVEKGKPGLRFTLFEKEYIPKMKGFLHF